MSYLLYTLVYKWTKYDNIVKYISYDISYWYYSDKTFD